jgi:hypothetical protein
VDKAVAPIEEPYSDRVNRRLAAIAEGILDEEITYGCLWDDFAAQGIKVEFDQRREGGADVIYVFLAAE